MTARRKPIRERDIVSFGRRTPRFDLVSLKEEVLETSKLAKVITPHAFASKPMQRAPQSATEDGPFAFQ